MERCLEIFERSLQMEKAYAGKPREKAPIQVAFERATERAYCAIERAIYML